MKLTSVAVLLAATGTAAMAMAAPASNGTTLVPRQPLPKTPTALLDTPRGFTGRAIVKFSDDVKARVTDAGRVTSVVQHDMSNVTAILEANQVKAVTAFPGVSPGKLQYLIDRAQAFSGEEQADLHGMMYLTGPAAGVETATRALNELALIEFVRFEETLHPDGNPALGTYPHAGNWREKRAEFLANNPEGKSKGIMPWADIDDPFAFEPYYATVARDMQYVVDQDLVAEVGEGERTQPVRKNQLANTQTPDFIDFSLGGDECEMGNGNCFDPAGNGDMACDDAACCATIGDLDEFCVMEEWDVICAAQANLFCGIHVPNDPDAPTVPPAGPDRCARGIFAQSCFAFGPLGGCSNGGCCFLICELDPNCCNVWDAACIDLALNRCREDIDMDAVTPDLSEIQGYASGAPYTFPLPVAYPWDRYSFPELAAGGPAIGGNGVGYDIFQAGESFSDFGVDGVANTNDEGEGNGWFDGGEPWDDFGRDGVDGTFDDGEGDNIWTEPGGILGFAQQAFFRDGIDRFGQGILARGDTLNIAFVDASFYPDHEEFAPLSVGSVVLDPDQRVIPEAGQRLWTDEEIASPSRGTAIASIVCARDETQFGIASRGVTGMVPNAQGYFYPVTTVDVGPRELAAWSNAIAELEFGDMILATYSAGTSILPNLPDVNILMQIATASGIGVFTQAGDGCRDISGESIFPDVGQVTVGAGSPGTNTAALIPFRIPSSNFQSIEDFEGLNSTTIHHRAWGAFVAAAGFGDLFRIDGAPGTGINPDRAYTGQFGGTGAAAAQICGVYAAVQGLHKQYYGFPMAPALARGLMNGGPSGAGVGARLFGVIPDTQPCGLDTAVEDGNVNDIGTYPQLAGPNSVVTRLVGLDSVEYADSPYVRDVILARGEYRGGSVFAIRGNDGQFYRAESEDTPAGARPRDSGPSGLRAGLLTLVPEMASARYLVGGDITDLVIIGESPTNSPTQMAMDVVSGPSEVFTVILAEMFNYRANRWQLIGASVGGNGTFAVPNPADFVGVDNRIVGRVYYVGWPGIGNQGNGTSFSSRTDLVNFTIVGGIDG
ncbi:MAG: hypothetical protein AB8G96_11965 [Phycisphaerales bacterium]